MQRICMWLRRPYRQRHGHLSLGGLANPFSVARDPRIVDIGSKIGF